MTFEPEGKVAVVTGAAGGIGLGMVRAFAGAGMRVVLADIDGERLAPAVDELHTAGREAVAVPTDVTRLESVRALGDAAMDTFGRVDVLCNNAGVGLFSTIAETTIEDWEWTIAIDLFGPIYGIKTFMPLIERNDTPGHVNSTSSLAGLVAGGAKGPYNVAKHGVVALMATLERELRSAKSLHRASVLCPGPINTDIGRNSTRRRLVDAGKPVGERAQSGGARKAGAALNNMLADRGMDPDRVGRLVLDAIVNEQFWIFTHPGVLRQVREQLDVAEADRMLTRLRLT